MFIEDIIAIHRRGIRRFIHLWSAGRDQTMVESKVCAIPANYHDIIG